MILFDTDVVSGLMHAPPDERLAAWMRSLKDPSIAVSTITVSEIAYGLARLPDGRRKAGLTDAADRLLPRFDIIDFNREMALRSALFRAQRDLAGRPMGHADAMIAATAAVLDATLATRNVRDFAGLSVVVVDPWLAGR